MGQYSNCERFPDTIFKPESIQVNQNVYELYRARFQNLYHIHEYLTSNPTINRSVFHKLSSVNGSYDFAGKPYEKAVEDLISEVDPGYQEFLSLQKDLKRSMKGKVHQYQTVSTVAGGHLNIPAYSMGLPLCYEVQERISKPKFVRIHISLSYYCGTTKMQVLNRAIIITNVLKALEDAGYNVDLSTSELSGERNELVHIVVQLKKHGSRLPMSSLYKTLCHVEFLRRILFRILETMPVQNDWESGYGQTCSESFVRKTLKLGENDIYFDQPREMGIYGNDLADDFETAMRYLNLKDKIDVEQASKQFRENTKVLTRR